LLGVLVVGGSVALAVAGLVLTNRLTPSLELRESHNAATGTIYAAFYVVYGVSLGFSLLLVWQQFQFARQTVEQEALATERIYRLVERFPDPGRERVQNLDVSYVRTVTDEEWPLMGRGETSSKATRLADELGQAVRDLNPRSEAQNALYSEMLARLDDLRESRALRLLEVRQGLPSIMWFVLILGGMLNVAFTYLFGLRSLLLHALAVAGLAAMLALVLFTIGVLDYPFNSSVRVGPDAFELVLRDIS
jgi:hypothetical protein